MISWFARSLNTAKQGGGWRGCGSRKVDETTLQSGRESPQVGTLQRGTAEIIASFGRGKAKGRECQNRDRIVLVVVVETDDQQIEMLADSKNMYQLTKGGTVCCARRNAQEKPNSTGGSPCWCNIRAIPSLHQPIFFREQKSKTDPITATVSLRWHG